MASRYQYKASLDPRPVCEGAATFGPFSQFKGRRYGHCHKCKETTAILKNGTAAKHRIGPYPHHIFS